MKPLKAFAFAVLFTVLVLLAILGAYYEYKKMMFFINQP